MHVYTYTYARLIAVVYLFSIDRVLPLVVPNGCSTLAAPLLVPNIKYDILLKPVHCNQCLFDVCRDLNDTICNVAVLHLHGATAYKNGRIDTKREI